MRINISNLAISRRCCNMCFISFNIFLLFVFFYLGNSKEKEIEFITKHLSEDEKRLALNKDFQKVGIGDEKNYVYSAWYFKNEGSASSATITVIAGLTTKSPEKLYCQLYTSDGIHYATVNSVLKDLSEDNDYYKMPYQTYYIFCNFDDNVYQLPSYVSVIDLNYLSNSTVSNLLKINYKDQDENYKYRFSVCVQPIFNYDDPIRFTEWVEFHRLFGVEKFTLYNISIGPKTSCVINSYGDLFEVLPWSNPYLLKEFRIHGQSMAHHDCLTRHKRVSNYLISLDLDEMIVPAIANNYSDMIKYFNSYYSQSEIVAYTFRNAFFFTEWITDDELFLNSSSHLGKSTEDVYKQLRLSSKLFRFVPQDKYASRSKHIVIPDKITEIAIHYIVEISGTGTFADIPFEKAYLHHYRNCKGIEEECQDGERFFDDSAMKYGESLAKPVYDRLYNDAEQCNVSIN